MKTKYEGQQVVIDAIENRSLEAVILNPASIMGPGDRNFQSPQNQMYDRLYHKKLIGSFCGGLAIVDVRDLVTIIIKSLSMSEIRWNKYLVVGENSTYRKLIKLLGEKSGKKVYPFKIPPGIITVLGVLNESFSKTFKIKAVLTYSYGKISGMYGYYSNRRSIEEFSHKYYSIEQTVEDGCRFFEEYFKKV
jgi:nucleoside-diphosphate-sugar epimerase